MSRIALLHDYLNQWGGAENVLEVLSETFPEAPIYTLLYDREKTYSKFDGRVAKTSFLDFPVVRNNHRAFIPLLPLAAQSIKVPEKHNLIISSSAGFGKGIKTPKNSIHICYCHTPLRYAWEPEYLISKFKIQNSKFANILTAMLLKYLRSWDYKSGQKPDILLANSNFIAEKIKKYYNRDATVIYPPVDLSVFYPEKTSRYSLFASRYFLAIGRFLHYKKFDLVIEAFKKLGLPLKIVGSGPEEKKLKSLASGSANIEFLPFENNTERLRALYSGARALIFPQVEDFGLVAAESIACGTPVIAYNAGGAKEIVNGRCGVLFNEQTPESLANAVTNFISNKNKWQPIAVAKEAERFSKVKFQNEIKKIAEMALV